MKALIIDLTDSHEIKILNTRITSSVSIISGYYMTLSGEDDPIVVAAEKLKQERLLDTPAYIVPPRGFVQSHTFLFPPMPDKELNKVLPREIADITDSGDAVVFNFVKHGTVMDRQVEKLEVAAFYSKKESTFDFLSRLKAEGMNPVKIIPEIQGLKTLVESNKELTSEKSGVVFLEIKANRIDLNIFKGQYWSLERDFAFQYEASDQLNDDDLSRISVELNRTFQYFKQRNRTYHVDKVVIFGTNPNRGHLKDFIMDNHPVSAEILGPGHFKTKIAYPSHLKDKDEFLSIFTLPILVSVSMTRKKILNLFPEEFTEKERLPRRLVGLGISTTVIASILIAGAVYFEGIKASYRQDIEGTKKTFQSLSRNAGLIEETKHQRVDYFKKSFFAEFPPRYSYSAANFIRRLSLIATGDIRLRKLEIKPRGQDFAFVLTGSIAAGDNIAALGTFNRFFRKLKEFEDMMDVNFSTIKVNAGDNRGGRATAGQNRDDGLETQNQVELFFTVNGEIELE